MCVIDNWTKSQKVSSFWVLSKYRLIYEGGYKVKESIRYALFLLESHFGESIFTDSEKFKSALLDVLVGSENELSRNLTNIAVGGMNVYARLKSVPPADISVTVHNLAKEMNRSYSTPEDKALIVIGCFAEILGYSSPSPEHDSGFDDLISKAHQGDAESQRLLGLKYRDGEAGFAKNLDEAFKWIKMAADQDCNKAQNVMGFFYIDDGYSQIHVEHNLGKAGFWFRKASGNGHPTALRNLIWAVFSQDESDHHLVMNAYKELANIKKDPESMVELGVILVGDPDSSFMSAFPSLLSYCDPKEGFRLIEEGVTLAESLPENPLAHNHYSEIYGAYQYETGRTHKPNSLREPFYKGLERLTAIERKIPYLEKSIALLKTEGKDDYPEDIFAMKLELYEKILYAAKEELRNEKWFSENLVSLREKAASFRGCFVLSTITAGLKFNGTVVATGIDYERGDAVSEWTSDWKDIIAIDGFDDHLVGLKVDGTVVAVGNNSVGQCDVSDWRDMTAICVGSQSTFGLKSDGTVMAIGNNSEGQCDVSGWQDVVDISVYFDRVAGLKSDGTVVATGNNNFGQCNVSDWKGIASIYVGSNTVGLKTDGTIVIAGNNHYEQRDVSDWRDVVAVAPSSTGAHLVGLKSDGTVVATGNNNFGQCNVSDWKGIVAISACQHTVGLKSDGTVVATGKNEMGQCDVYDLQNIVAISAESFTFAFKDDGTVSVVGSANVLEEVQRDVPKWQGIGPFNKEKAQEMLDIEQKKRKENQEMVESIAAPLRVLRDEILKSRLDAEKAYSIALEQYENELFRHQEEVAKAKVQADSRLAQGLCPHCGGATGLFKKCKVCKLSSSHPIKLLVPPKPPLLSFSPAKSDKKKLVDFGGIKWRVLDANDNSILLLSEMISEERLYHDYYEGVTWETCTLRKYLNTSFYENFGELEKSMIIETTNNNYDNPWLGSIGGNATKDKVFLLSIEEIVKYFGDSGTLQAGVPKDRTQSLDDKFNEARIGYTSNHCVGNSWWLRSPGYTGSSDGNRNDYAAYVEYDGQISLFGSHVQSIYKDIQPNDHKGIRPALWLKLN